MSYFPPRPLPPAERPVDPLEEKAIAHIEKALDSINLSAKEKAEIAIKYLEYKGKK